MQNPLDPESSPPLPPINLNAIKMHDTVMSIYWDASPTPVDSILYYVLSVTGKEDLIVTKNLSSYDIMGLVPGIYTLSLRTKGTNHLLSAPASIEVKMSSYVPEPPINLMANSGDGSVTIRWMPPTGVQSPKLQSFQLIVWQDDNTSSDTIEVAKTATSHTVAGLTNGKLYTFYMRSKSIEGVTGSSSWLQWSPAQRYTNIRLYESASSSFGSGLDLSTGEVLYISQGNRWDIGLDTRPVNGQSSYDIGSPALTSYTLPGKVRTTLLSDKRYEFINSLDQVFDTEVLGGPSRPMTPETERLVNFTYVKQGFVFFAKTQEGNFAKIFVKSKDGVILQGTAPNRYIEMDISYQTAVNIPYALTDNFDEPVFKTASNSSVKKSTK